MKEETSVKNLLYTMIKALNDNNPAEYYRAYNQFVKLNQQALDEAKQEVDDIGAL